MQTSPNKTGGVPSLGILPFKLGECLHGLFNKGTLLFYSFYRKLNTILNFEQTFANFLFQKSVNYLTLLSSFKNEVNAVMRNRSRRNFWEVKLKFEHNKTQRKVMSLFRDFLEGSPPPHLPDCLQNAITFFSIWSLLSSEKYVRQKPSLCLFSKNNLSLSVFHHFTLFLKNESFLPKITYIGGKQTN